MRAYHEGLPCATLPSPQILQLLQVTDIQPPLRSRSRGRTWRGAQTPALHNLALKSKQLYICCTKNWGFSAFGVQLCAPLDPESDKSTSWSSRPLPDPPRSDPDLSSTNFPIPISQVVISQLKLQCKRKFACRSGKTHFLEKTF